MGSGEGQPQRAAGDKSLNNSECQWGSSDFILRPQGDRAGFAHREWLGLKGGVN